MNSIHAPHHSSDTEGELSQTVDQPRYSILLVDDDLAIRRLIELYLRRDFDVVGFETVAQAWRYLQTAKVDLILSDINMPGETGLDLHRRVNARQGVDTISFIFLSSLDEDDALAEFGDPAIDDYLTKPVSKERLLRVIHRVINRSHHLQERMSRRFDMETQDLRNEMEQKDSDYARLIEDLEEAAHIQRSLLPAPIDDLLGLSFAWWFMPSCTVAGDIFNYQVVDNRFICFYQLDVSGHGIPAAMLSVTLSRLLSVKRSEAIRNMVRQGASAVIERLNQEFQANNTGGSYFTIVFGIFDSQTHRVSFVQAGHPHPLYINRDGEVTALGSGGLPVGLVPRASYETTEFTLEPGSRLILCSDGFSDAKNPRGEFYGSARLEELVTQTASLSRDSVLGGLRSALHEWHGEGAYEDDVSVLIIEHPFRPTPSTTNDFGA